MKLRLVCPCHFGLESVLKFEMNKIGGEDITVKDGRVEFTGDLSVLVRANICLLSAERVLVKLGEFKAETFEELFQGVKALPLEDFIGKADRFPVKGHSLGSTLKSVPDCQSIIKKAAVERLKQRYGISWFEETGALYQLQFGIMNNIASIYIDSTGEGLHKRGYRKNSVTAPIKETLAAGMVDLARIRENSIVCDPFCGSGTFLIEAAYKAMNIAPGLNRRFESENWGVAGLALWKEERERARAAIKKETDFFAYGYDNDPEAVALTAANCKKAGVSDRVSVKTADIKSYKAPPEAITICNPPYGERMLEIKEAEALYSALGKSFSAKSFREAPYYVITPHEEFESFFGYKPDKKRKLYNGMIKCQLYMYFK
ncbi:MAG: class I SAM-dependent RNA methyltransferase [Oscillospiraceae bacterium]|nr:class I SAM-dependent RNA methyltransferase [Oscillospiraceae bacterium]